MPTFWMVRAGSGGYLIDQFLDKGLVAIGFGSPIDLTPASTKVDVKRIVKGREPDMSVNALAALGKFRCAIEDGDPVVTYSPTARDYYLGHFTGGYLFKPGLVEDHPHVRCVKWYPRGISRDALSPAARNTLGSTLTLFEPGDDVKREFEKLVNRDVTEPEMNRQDVEDVHELGEIREDMVEKSHEFIKDAIAQLAWDALQDLVAAILRAMGYKTRVSPAGNDRGKDIVASPDGLGLSPPRIKVEVKHRQQTQMGAPEIRSFIGGLRGEDRGLYVSTGGFSREAHYEAERSALPVNLIDLDILASLLVQHYEALDSEGKALVPLTRIYWPTRAS